MITYRFTLSIGYPGAIHEDEITVEEIGYSDREWNNLSEQEREDELEEYWKDWISNFIDGYWEKIQ